MKCLAFGLSSAAIVLFAASEGVAQEHATPPANPAETTATNPAPNASASAPNPLAPVAQPAPIAPATPNSPPAGYGYPPYGYPYGGMPWGLPPEPPKEMVYKGGPIPNGYKYEERYNMGLLIAGPTLFLLSYALAAFTAGERPGGTSAISTFATAPWNALYVPLAGPFAFSGYAPTGSAFIYIFDGLGQAVGVGLFLRGILAPKDLLVRQFRIQAFRPILHVGPRSMQLQMQF